MTVPRWFRLVEGPLVWLLISLPDRPAFWLAKLVNNLPWVCWAEMVRLLHCQDPVGVRLASGRDCARDALAGHTSCWCFKHVHPFVLGSAIASAHVDECAGGS